MKPKQIFRDIIILVGFCGGFYLLTQAVNLLGDDSLKRTATSAFSQARRDADRHLDQGEFGAAIPHLVNLTEQDPYNSHAWYRLGICYGSLASTNRMPSLANNLTPDLDKAKENTNKAIEAYEKAIEFPRYRSMAKIGIAKLYVQEDEELALQYLDQAVNDGGFSRRTGFRRYRALFKDPELKKIERLFYQRLRRSRARDD